MTKRRLISLLPQVHQTVDLTAFFGTTVDQVFQPGGTDQLSGYIGHTIGTLGDFYLSEPTDSRAFYQLEPGMVSYDAVDANSINYSLTYPDLVAALAVRGADVSDHERLFETDYYSWSPPINIDMLVNYHKYYWFGDTQRNVATYTFNKYDKHNDVVLANGDLTAASATYQLAPVGVRSVPLEPGAWYVEFTIANSGITVQELGLANLVDGLNPGEPGMQSDHNAIIYTSNGAVYYDNGPDQIPTPPIFSPTPTPLGPTILTAISNDLAPWGVDTDTSVIGMAWSTVHKKVWFRVGSGPWDNAGDNPTENLGGFDITDLLAKGPACVLWAGTQHFCQATVNFGATSFVEKPPVDYVGPATTLSAVDLPVLTLHVPHIQYNGDSHTQVFALPAACRAVPTSAEQPTAYVNNVLVSATLIDPDHLQLAVAPFFGSVVMVSRTPDLAAVIAGALTVDVSDLNPFGVTQLSSTMCVKMEDTSHMIDGWDREGQRWDETPWDVGDDATFLVDGIGVGLRLTPMSTLLRGHQAQHVTIDRSSLDRNPWSLRNAWVHADSFAWSGQTFGSRQATQPIIEFIRDIVLYPVALQPWSDRADPLFMLYRLADHSPLDSCGLSGGRSSFKGNRIFGFAAALSGDIDPALSRQLLYDQNGYLMFSNDAASLTYTCTPTQGNASTPITGLALYAVQDAEQEFSYRSFWQPAAQPTTQPLTQFVTSGFYTIPANLEANPDYEEVNLVSRSTWFGHFNGIIANQVGLIGSPVGANNYRDTARDLRLGSKILQHHAPMLKLMLLESAASFDLLRAVRYAEVEYTRFRNKFVRKLIDLRNRGVLQDSDAASLWVSAALAALKVGHTQSFPFALSTMAGGQNYIPATPTALGLMPAAVPTSITDTTHAAPIVMLLGHDGSLTPQYGDWRDPIMLALETQIYQTLPAFNTPLPFDLQRWIGSRFYTAPHGYTRAEASAVLAPMFELWAQLNRLDYRTHVGYDATDPFTWNYRGVLDVGGQPLPGHWRGIYCWYYDTDAPHTRPWEMLGFIDQPTWWVGRYGAAPYTSSNSLLWTDLTNGLIASGPRAGIDARYARPGLRNFLPVNAAGTLLNPVAAGIVTTSVILELGRRDWQAGDHGPAESVWWHSPAARYAQVRAGYLLKPARCVEQCWDTVNIGYTGAQWVDLRSFSRPRNALQYVHGEIDPALSLLAPSAVVGLSQWLVDYLVSTGQSSRVLGDAVRGTQVALMHPVAGFVSEDEVQVVTDSFGLLLPVNDFHVVLYASPAVSSEVYSGVIIEWTGSTWRVLGYDGRNPTFTIIPPNVTGAKGLISLATAAEPSIVPWRSGTYYPVQILVDFQNSVYQCTRSHTSAVSFEQIFWTARPDLATAMIRAPRVVTYRTGLPTTQSVPYGTEYRSYQEIADFLLGWERWLVSRGWSFTALEPQTNRTLNWSLSVEEFLAWAQVQWAPGNFIALSPGQRSLDFLATTGTILNVEDNVTGFYGLINRSGQPISQRDAVITRLDGAITLAANNADIFLARLNISTIEHVLVLKNTTVFSNVIYMPLFGLRQERVRLTCNRATQWTGRLDAPGFIINGNRLRSSFEKAANDIRLMYDIELADVDVLRDYARHGLGMQERSYLNNLLLSDHTQFEFYQGMIQEKGTPDVFRTLTRSKLATSNSTLHFLEEWAIRLGRFGAPLDRFVTFQLTQTDARDDPQFVHFSPSTGAPLDWIELSPTDSRWYDRPTADTFFTERTDYAPAVLPTAGPVRLNEVGNTVFHLTDVPALYDPTVNSLPLGARIWVYDSPPQFEGVNWYVSADDGSDSNDGSSLATAFATLQQAHDVSNPGDVINVAAGVYSQASGTNVLEIARSGIASAPILYQALAGTKPIIVGTQSAAAIHFNSVSYVTVRGFEVIGWSDTLDLNQAQAVTGGIATVTAQYNGSGIVIDRAASTQGVAAPLPHHCAVLDCEVHHFPNNGITVSWADYITVRGCTVHDNAGFSPLAGSGINVLNSHGIDNQSEYKNFIQQNICYNNKNQIVNGVTHTFTDGNGIAIAGNSNAQTDGIAYNGRTLVENNLCYNNGGNGIVVNDSAHVDIIYNTVYRNQTQTGRPYGEILAIFDFDVNIYNNIMVANPGRPISLGNDFTAYKNNVGDGGDGQAMPGVSSRGDPLFRAPPTDFSLLRGSHAIQAADQKFTTGLDLAGNLRSAATGYDIGCYQSGSAQSVLSGRHPFTVLHSFDTGPYDDTLHTTAAGSIAGIVTPTENPALSSTRISFTHPMTLLTTDAGNYIVIDGFTGAAPELEGIQRITAVNPDSNSIDIASVGRSGVSFPGGGPSVRVLRPIRFETVAAVNPQFHFQIGDLIWIDRYIGERWAVLSWNGADWLPMRLQPHRIDPLTIGETVIYSAGAQIKNHQMILNRPVVDDVVVIDPLAGLICNISDREITYRTEYDPARYNAGFGIFAANLWGPNEIGQVWWNLAAVRFLDPFTDTLNVSTDETRDRAELQYRIDHWARVAPNTSVDVYEWTESRIDPLTYSTDASSPGTVFNADAPSWVERVAFDPVMQRDVTFFYFWVAGLTLTPNQTFRRTNVVAVALGIENPSALNIAWTGAISANGLVVSGVTPYLDDTTTVMKIRLIDNPENAGRHDQWLLMRPDDDSSLPPDFLWSKVVDGLAGFAVADGRVVPVPDPLLPLARGTGIELGQSIFQVRELLIPAWQGAHTYYYGDQVSNRGIAYQCIKTGISAADGSTWNPADASASIGLGNNNLTAQSITQTSQSVRSTSSRVSGKLYFEVQANAITADFAIGLTNAAYDLGLLSELGSDVNGLGYYPVSPPQSIYTGDANEAPLFNSGEPDVSGAIFSVAVDLDARLLWVASPAMRLAQHSWNSSANADPALGLGGVSFAGLAPGPYFVTFNDDNGRAVATVNFGATPFNRALPNGYVAWDSLAAGTATGPAGFGSTISDGTVLWTYHGTDDTLAGLRDARAAFVASINNVFAAVPMNIDRAALLAPLRRASPYDAFLTWAQIDPSYAYEPPPSNEWQAPWEVHSLSERNELLANERFQDAIRRHNESGEDTSIAVLLNGFANIVPQWSIWVFDPGVAQQVIDDNPSEPPVCAMIRKADLIFYLKPAYERIVASVAERNDLLHAPNMLRHQDRVLVITDLSGFWAIYQWWQPDAKQAGAFNLWRAQSYDTSTSTFIESVDWYDDATLTANNYSSTNPPAVVYPSLASRDATEGDTPTNLLVRIADDGLGHFLWTLYVAGAWQVVAVGNGTIRLSSQFYDRPRPMHAVSGPLLLSDVNGRDGAWEMRIISHAIRHGHILLDSEINQLWFNLLNFVHVQQNEVDWAFKTSFMSLAGIAIAMEQSPALQVDQTANVIAYINEVKPYRVKVRDWTTQYSPAVDLASFTVTDFDDPVLVDPVTGLQRPLDPTDPADTVTLEGPEWTEWYHHYLDVPPPLVRSFAITLVFDRLSGVLDNWDITDWDSQGWDIGEGDGGAAYRILTYYQPTEGMPPLDLTSLLNLGEQENTINSTLLGSYNAIDDGGTLVPEAYSVDINPAQTSRPGGYDLRPPYYQPEHPEERVVFGADDGLQITVTADPLPGGPPQIIKVFDVGTLSGSTTVLFFDLLAQAAAAVLVYCDGVRAVQGTDYTVDHFNRSITLNLTVNGSAVQRVLIHAFGFGGTSAITEQHYLAYGTNTLTLSAPTAASKLAVVVAGSALTASGFTVSGSTVSLTSPPSTGTDVALLTFSGGSTTAAQIHVQTLAYTNPQVWTLQFPDLQTVPAHAGTIVEVNGLRLTPLTTYYGSMTVATPWVYLPLMPSNTTIVTVYVNGVLYTSPIPICLFNSASSPYPFGLILPGDPPPLTVAGQFVLYNNLLVALDPTFIAASVVIVLDFVETPPDYTVISGVLTINPLLSNTASIRVTTFSNAACLGIETVSFALTAVEQHIIAAPFAPAYAHVTMNGRAILPDDDYSIDTTAFTTGDVYFTAPVIHLNAPTSGSVVATVFTLPAARDPMLWRTSTRTPAFIRMLPIPRDVTAGWDATPLDAQPYDDAQFPSGPSGQFSIQDRFESIRLSPYMAGTLVADVGVAATSLSIALFLQPLAAKLQEDNPLPLPDAGRKRPGVIWIGAERIEYFGYARTGNTVTLSALRRATRGTSTAPQRLINTGIATGAAQTFSFTNTGVVDVTITPAATLSVPQPIPVVQPPANFMISGTTDVTLTASAGSYIAIGLTIAATHLAGETVWHGAQSFLEDVPIGPAVGNRELEPMHRIIAG